MGCLHAKPVPDHIEFEEDDKEQQPAVVASEDITVETKLNSVDEVIAAADCGKLEGVLDLSIIKDGDDSSYEPPLIKYFLDDPLDEVPAQVFECTNITTFTIKGNHLVDLSPSIGKANIAASLLSLDLSENRIASLPEELGELKALTSLDVSENKIKSFPVTIGNLTGLKTLFAFKNMLSQLPNEIGECASLEQLNLFNNKLIKLPASASDLSALRDLNVGGNKLKTLPSTDKWTQLEELRAHQNTLIMLPSFSKMTALRFLKLDMNRALQALPDFGTYLDKQLEHLECGNCDIKELPETLFQVQSLRVLQTQSNSITSIPDKINLPELDTLNVSTNKLAALPGSLSASSTGKLRVLFFSGNADGGLDLAALPDGLTQLPKLERVMCGGNNDSGGNAAIVEHMQGVCAANGGWVK